MFTTNWRPLHTHEDTELSAYRLWLQYIDEKNDRSLVHEDDDKWGINTAQCGKNIAFRKELAGSEAPEIQQFREHLIAVFQYKDLMMDIQDALTVYNEEYNVNDAADLIRLGVMTDMNQAMDVTIPITLKSTEPHFDYFFAVKCGQLDLMEYPNFLKYQLRESFNGNATEFARTVKLITIKYSAEKAGTPFVSPHFAAFFENYSNQITTTMMPVTPESNSPENKKLTSESEQATELLDFNKLTRRQQALILMISLEALGLDLNHIESVASVARMFHLITNTPITKVRNSELYKMLNNTVGYKNKKITYQDLLLIKAYFERVQWDIGLEKLSLKIKKLEEK